MKSSRTPISIFLLGVILGTAVTSCYTMLGHPEVSAYPESGEAAEDQKTCADCHADSDLYHWATPYYTSLYGVFPESWGYYYYHPWGLDDSFYPWAPWPVSGPVQPVADPGRHSWDRGPGAPTIPGVGGAVIPSITPAPKPPQGAQADTTKAPRANRELKPPDASEPHAWGR